MRTIKVLALAALFAAGTSASVLAEDEVTDSIRNYEPIYATPSAATPARANVPQTMTPAAQLQVPASPWIAGRFNADRTVTFEEKWFFRAEAPNAGTGSD